jgi:hypothetical protein
MWGTAQKREFGHPTLTLAVLDTVGAFLKLGPAPVVAAAAFPAYPAPEMKRLDPKQHCLARRLYTWTTLG